MTTAVALRNQDLILAGPVGSLDAYIQAVGAVPVLSKEDEQALAVRFREDEDLDAARELVMAHLRFVVHIAKGYTGYGLPLGDLIQEGKRRSHEGRQALRPRVRRASRIVRRALDPGRDSRVRAAQLAHRQGRHDQGAAQAVLQPPQGEEEPVLAHYDETQAVAEDLGVSPKEVTEMEKRLHARDAIFDPAPDTDDERAFTPAAYLPSPDSDPAKLVETADFNQDASERMASSNPDAR